MESLIGNTPLIKINYKIKSEVKYIYAKLEWYSLTGSIKDRMAEYIYQQSKKQGLLKNKQTIVETTSGNTGIAIAALGAKYKHKVVIFMPDSVSKERIEILKIYGADIRLVKVEDGGFQKCIELSKIYAKEHDAFLFNQFKNDLNIEAHEKTTAKEITDKLDKIDYFVSGIGSGGTAMGVLKGLQKKGNTKLVIVEPFESQIIKNNTVGKHKIEGIGDDFIPEIVDVNQINKIISIKSDDAILMSRKISRELGLGVGISSGANALASILINEENKKIVTIFSDDLKKYLSTDLTKEMKSNEFIDSITFLSYELV